jgi:hypothetical protein
VRVYTGRDLETKKRTYLNQTIYGGLRDTQAHLNKMLGERDCGRRLDSSKQTLNQYLDRWLELFAKPRLRAKSLKDYEGLLRRYVRPGLGPKIFIHLSVRHPGPLPRSPSPESVGPLDPLYPRGPAVGVEAGDALEPHPVNPGRLS